MTEILYFTAAGYLLKSVNADAGTMTTVANFSTIHNDVFSFLIIKCYSTKPFFPFNKSQISQI